MFAAREQSMSIPRTSETEPVLPIYRGHIPELDAIRGIGIALVLMDHFWPRTLGVLLFSLGQLGWIAMDSFFVLSGFLITGILVDTRSRPDYFRNYYLRRSLRIFPLYYLVLLTILFLTHISQGGHGAENAALVRQWGSPAWFYFYLGNFRLAYVGAWPMVAPYAPLWSLQIEEQFYLLLPFAVRWMRLDHLSRLLWSMVFLSPALRILFFLHNPNNPFPEFVLLPCHMEGLALGALIAIRFRTGPWPIRKGLLAALTVGLLLAACVGSFIANPIFSPILAGQLWSSPFNLLAGISLSSFGCACLVLSLIVFRGSRSARPLRIAPIAYIAQISYGIYLLHRLAPRFLRWSGKLGIHLKTPYGVDSFIALVVLSVAAATLSWYFFEKPFMKLKDQLAPRHTADETAVAV
jgi:peptidoglycan/LPS O-acetylase OafA/YrhL